MKKEVTVTIDYVSGEEGLNRACREGKLFRNDQRLENLYKDGFRIYNYSIIENSGGKRTLESNTRIKVFLVK